jgi:hypothetical protein
VSEKKRRRRPNRDEATTALEIFGACLVTVGVALHDVGYGLLVAGILTVGLGYLLAGGDGK